MNVDEIREGLNEAGRQPRGRGKSERLELLAEAAKATSDRDLEADALLRLIDSYEYGSERERMPVAFGRLLKIYDEFPAELGGRTYSVHWQLKWMSFALVRNPAIPLPTARKWLDEMESRYRQRGYSARPVHALRSMLALQDGDEATAAAAMEASIDAPRDIMADCEACERNDWGYLRAALGDDEGATRHWEPVITGRLRCAEEPARVLAMSLLPLVRLGRLDDARSAHLRGYQLARRNISLRKSVGCHLEFCGLTGNEPRGLEILAEHVGWLRNSQEDVDQRLQFLVGAAVLLQRLSALDLGDTRIGDASVDAHLATVSPEIDEICARYDARNGNQVISTQIRGRLDCPPFADWLPLGTSAKLPAPTRASLADVPRAARGDATLSELIAEAEQKTQQRHPHAGRAWSAVAARAERSGETLPETVRLEIDRRRAEKLVATDPTTAHDAFLAIAERYAQLGRPGEGLSSRSLAARVLSRGDEPAEAEAAAGAILADAEVWYAAGEINARQYLTARRAGILIAFENLGSQKEKPAGEVDALAARVETEARIASELGDPGRAAAYHEMLNPLRFWQGDRPGALEQLAAALDGYVEAGQPWHAAGPSFLLGQAALDDGDAARAEGYGRRALEAGGGLLPARQSAMASSLIVEAVSRQPERELDVIDAALRAAARWEGISDPDALHYRFMAARVYHRLGRHQEAVAIFAELMPRVEIPYDKPVIAATRRQYGASLKALRRPKEAAEQFIQAAQLLREDENNRHAYAEVSWEAAQALHNSGQPKPALAAFEHVIELWQQLGEPIAYARCTRSAAWLRYNAGEQDAALSAMNRLRDELESRAADSEGGVAAELAHTEEQLAQMLSTANAVEEEEGGGEG